jgi:RNA polymerase sigma-70 factor (ECF subfamily)
MEFRKGTIEGKRTTKLKYELNQFVENAEETHLHDAQDKEFVLQHLKEGMDVLKDEQRTCVELFYLKECSYNEIANVTGFDLNEVKSHIQNGKRNLKNYITAQNDQAQKG